MHSSSLCCVEIDVGIRFLKFWNVLLWLWLWSAEVDVLVLKVALSG